MLDAEVQELAARENSFRKRFAQAPVVYWRPLTFEKALTFKRSSEEEATQQALRHRLRRTQRSRQHPTTRSARTRASRLLAIWDLRFLTRQHLQMGHPIRDRHHQLLLHPTRCRMSGRPRSKILGQSHRDHIIVLPNPCRIRRRSYGNLGMRERRFKRPCIKCRTDSASFPGSLLCFIELCSS